MEADVAGVIQVRFAPQGNLGGCTRMFHQSIISNNPCGTTSPALLVLAHAVPCSRAQNYHTACFAHHRYVPRVNKRICPSVVQKPGDASTNFLAPLLPGAVCPSIAGNRPVQTRQRKLPNTNPIPWRRDPIAHDCLPLTHSFQHPSTSRCQCHEYCDLGH